MRHLIFHLTPIASPAARACWAWHLRQLNHYADVFDGQRLFAVAAGPGLLPAEEVASLLPPRSQVISLPNHPELREAYTLPMLLARAFSVAPDDLVFYAHSKGTSWVGTELETTTRWWSLAMYRWLTSGPAIDQLQQFPTVGWLKFQGQTSMFPAWSKWHYPGTFWWFRAAHVFGRDWWSVFPGRYGAEAYLGTFFEDAAAASLYNIPAGSYFTANGLAAPYTRELWAQIPALTGPDAESYDGSPA